MVNLPEDELVKVWRKRIERAKEIRCEEKKKVWDPNLEAYRGCLKPPSNVWNPSDPWISIELVHSSVRSAVPSLLYHNPKLDVFPTAPEFDENTGADVSWEKAHAKELWLNHIWELTQGNEHVRVAIVSAFLALGCVKVGYAPDFADDDKRGEFEYDEEGGLIPEGKPDADGHQLYRLKKGEYLYEDEDEDGEGRHVQWDEEANLPVLHPGTLRRETFFIQWVSWENMLFDPDGGNCFENHRYVIEEWVKPVDEVRNDPRYRQFRRKVRGTERLDGTRIVPDSNTPETPDSVRQDEERCRGYDIYDFETNRLMVVLDELQGQSPGAMPQNEKFLMDDAMPAGVIDGPFCFLKFNEDPGKWYPRTDVEGMSKVELEYNLTRSQMAVHRMGAKTRYLESSSAGFAGDDSGDTQRELFASGPSGVVVRVKSVEGIVPARKDSMDNAMFQAIPNIRMDFAEVAGQGGEARGVADADTATQASLVAAGADLRNNDRRDNLVQAFIVKIGTKLLQSAAANSSQVEYVQVAPAKDSPNPFDFKKVSPEQLEGDSKVGITVGSTQPKNSMARVQLLERMVTVIAQNPVLASAPTLMRRMFDAIDIRDQNLEDELMKIGQAALAQMQGPPGAPGQGQAPAEYSDNNQVLQRIANQHVNMGNQMQGMPTGARAS